MVGLAIVTFMRSMHGTEQHIEPADYVKASGELIFIALGLSWAITAVARPDAIEDNPLKQLFGYNNPCVAWDVPPAIYPAASLYTLAIYCSIRYAVTDTRRAALKGDLEPWKYYLSLVANWSYVLSMCAASCLFVVTPTTDVIAHTAVFIQLMLFRMFMIIANFVEAGSSRVLPTEWCYLAVYCLTTTCSCAFATVTLAAGHQVIPTGLMMTADYMWFATLPLTTICFPEQSGRLSIQSQLISVPHPPTRLDLLCCRRCLPTGALEDIKVSPMN